MRNLSEAIEYIHSREIIHRDIKPENILINDLNDLNSIKLADFGLSTQYLEEQEEFERCGTVIYMSPEQMAGKKFYTKNVDIWSCGIILYILLNGIHPFLVKGDTLTKYSERLKSFSGQKLNFDRKCSR